METLIGSVYTERRRIQPHWNVVWKTRLSVSHKVPFSVLLVYSKVTYPCQVTECREVGLVDHGVKQTQDLQPEEKGLFPV